MNLAFYCIVSSCQKVVFVFVCVCVCVCVGGWVGGWVYVCVCMTWCSFYVCGSTEIRDIRCFKFTRSELTFQSCIYREKLYDKILLILVSPKRSL